MNIIRLEPDRWEEYKNLSIAAVEDSPTAFARPANILITEPESHWRGKLEHSDILPGNWLRFAEIKVDNTPGRLVGMLSGSEDSDPKVIILLSLFVEKEYRILGIANSLLETILGLASHSHLYDKSRLFVSTTQLAAISLYQKHGFATIAEHDVTMSDGVQHRTFQMEKKLL